MIQSLLMVTLQHSQCRRLCDVSADNGTERPLNSTSSPLVFSDVNCGRYCTISLNGIYDTCNNIHTLVNGFTFFILVGKHSWSFGISLLMMSLVSSLPQ